MTHNGQFVILGSGGSAGVPVIGCGCEVCSSEHPYNHRTRPAAFLKVDGKRILIDAGPDVRMQSLNNQIKAIDGVIFTHTHYDHTGGLDDLRVFYFHNNMEPLPALISREGYDDILRRFYYMFETKDPLASMTARLNFTVLDKAEGKLEFLGLPIRYVSYKQGGMGVNGFRFGDLAYLTDIRDYSETIFDHLFGLKTLVVSALRFTSSHLHFSIDEAIEFGRKVGAKRVFFTHLAHDLDYEKTMAYLPEGFALAYDGLVIDFSI